MGDGVNEGTCINEGASEQDALLRARRDCWGGAALEREGEAVAAGEAFGEREMDYALGIRRAAMDAGEFQDIWLAGELAALMHDTLYVVERSSTMRAPTRSVSWALGSRLHRWSACFQDLRSDEFFR